MNTQLGKFLKLIGQLLFILCMVMSAFTCKQKLLKKVNYSGTVYDKINGVPLEGAKVELKACGGGPGDKAFNGCNESLFSIGSATTDNTGHFSINGKAATSDIYYITLEYQGFIMGINSAKGATAAKLTSDYEMIYLH